MNTELLFQLYAIHSPSGGEKRMRRFIRKYITNNCGDVEMVTDRYGNLLCTKGVSDTYPCLASHMDQVQRNHSKDFTVVTNGDVCFGYSRKSHEQQGLGADDKNGIWVCLECLKKYDVLKVAFFVGEETGCVGSSEVDLEFFKDCRFIVQPDRKGDGDLITSMWCGDVCSDDFIKAIGAERFGYRENEGTVTDVGELVERGVGISCLNLSCGYYDAHTSHEFTVLSELLNCLDLVMHIIDVCREVSYFVPEVSYSGYYGGYNKSCYGRYDGYSYDYGQKPYVPSAKQSFGTVKSLTSEIDDYYAGGMYDQDFETMQTYLEYGPSLSFEEVFSTYGFDFYASELGYAKSRDILSEMYDDVKELLVGNVTEAKVS